MFSPQLVVSYLSEEFGPCDISRKPTQMEQRIIDNFSRILREALYNNLTVDCEEDEVMEDYEADPTWSEESDENIPPKGQGLILFGETQVSEETVDKAISFYRSAEKGSRSLSSMHKSFRFINSPYHLLKLRELEKKQVDRADRVLRLRQLKEKLREVVKMKFDAGVSLHDNDLRQMALRINQEDFHLENFKASHSWLQDFKRCSGIVTRRITTFISKKNFLESDVLAEAARRFVSDVKREMKNWTLDCICNADQSGFVKEMHPARTLAEKGAKKVVRVVQSVAATTHSFTIMPTIYADGHLGEKLFVVLQERQGCFPRMGHFHADNLVIRANTTHMMNKELLLDWVRSCIAPSTTTSTLLIVDSWTSFKDHGAIQSAMPDDKFVKIMNIPPGTTSRIQPLDVHFFLPFEAMYKRFTSHVLALDLDFTLHHRDSILKILSLIYTQFCSPRFKNFLSYPWHAAGYIDNHPGEFESPIQYCFSSSLIGNCEAADCHRLYFIRCARCEKLFCFEHFVILFHTC